jgi:hypothetical protein
MRIAAGSLLIIGAVVMGGVAGVASSSLSLFDRWGYYLPFCLNPIFVLLVGITLSGVVLAGGILAIKRKQWSFCLASSIAGWAILPLIFICLRKGEWDRD